MNLAFRYRCTDCGQDTARLLTAPHPFVLGEEIHACPNPRCHNIMGGQPILQLCDVPGCTQLYSAPAWGDPTRYTCAYHEETP